MGNTEPTSNQADEDAPRRFRPSDLAARYLISERLAGDWIRWMAADGVLRKLRGTKIGRWSKVDAWVESGGETRRGRGAK